MNAEKINESESNNLTSHPLEDMPTFEEHMRQIESFEEVNGESISDKIVERIFDKVGRDEKGGYFKDPDQLLHRFDDTLNQSPKEVIERFKRQIHDYQSSHNEKYAKRAEQLFRDTEQNVKKLASEHLVGDDTIKVFLTSDYLDQRYGISEYSTIQEDDSRKKAEVWHNKDLAANRFQFFTKELADSYAERDGDVMYQGNDPYSPDKTLRSDFIHINSQRPRSNKNMLRCYISPDMTKDPAAVIYAWKECINESPLRDELYFKFNTRLNPDKKAAERPDSIVIYKTEDINDDQFKELLQSFQAKCNELSPDLLPEDESRMPTATRKIANGISISAEPDYINDYLRFTDKKDGKHSWTTFVDKITSMSLTIAANRLGVVPDSINVPGLEDETKKVFREFMLLSKINPDTMLQVEFGDNLPAWANLENNSTPKEQQEATDTTETTNNNNPTEAEAVIEKRALASGDKSTAYEISRPDGTKSTSIESEYFDIAKQFIDNHDIQKYDKGLRSAMSDFAIDLATIDIAHGKNFDEGNDEMKKSLLEDFSTLRGKLDDPNSPPDEKQLIRDYFNSMDGKALRFLNNRYMREKNNNSGQDDKANKLKAMLSETKENLERVKNNFADSSSEFDSALLNMNELIDSKSYDLDELQDRLNALIRARDELIEYTGSFSSENKKYESDIFASRSLFSEEEFKSEQIAIDDNDESIKKSSNKIAMADDRISKIKTYISNIEDSLRAFGR